jgi:membrane-associated phospholipid phosphatase
MTCPIRIPKRQLAALLALVLAAPWAARAEPGWLEWTEATPSDALALRLPADVFVLGGTFILWGGSQGLRSAVGPQRCNLCNGPDNLGLPGEPSDGRQTLNGVDAWFHDALTGWLVSRKSADTISSGFAYGVAPALALGGALFATGPNSSDWAGARAAIIVAESLGVSGLVGQALKFGIARKRPFIRYGTGTDGSTAAEGSTYDVNDPDSHFSFASGHTSATASMLVSVAMCASMQDSRAAPWLWAGAGTVTILTGTLRMVAEKHYFTDVLGGTVVGALAGIAVPLLHRPGSLLGTDRGGTLSVTGGAGTLGLVYGAPF